MTERIRSPEWIPTNIEIGIDAAVESDRIALDIASNRRVVVPRHVVQEIGFLVGVLPREPQREAEGDAIAIRVLIGCVVPKRLLLLPPPHRRTCSIGNKPGCVQMIRTIVSW